MNISFVLSLVIQIIIIENVKFVENYCQINTKDLVNVPIFLEKFGSTHRFISIEKNGMLNLKSGRSIIATCGGSVFSIKDDKRNETKIHNINIYCNEDFVNNTNKYKLMIEYKTIDENKHVLKKSIELNKLRSGKSSNSNANAISIVQSNNYLSCKKNVIQFFNYNVKGCGKKYNTSGTGILAGFINNIYENYNTTGRDTLNVDDKRKLIKLIEYCYDESELRTIFVNHIVAARSPFIEHQTQYNTGYNLKKLLSTSSAGRYADFIESNAATADDDDDDDDDDDAAAAAVPNSIVELFSGNIEKLYDQNRLKKHFESLLGNVYSNIALSKVNLVPEHTLPIQFKSATDIYLNAAIQWTGLRDGNWCKLQDDIKNIVKNELIAGVYTGTSGVIGVHDSWNKFQHLFVNTEQMLEASMPVPLYYWTVIKTQSKIIYDQQKNGDVLNKANLSNYSDDDDEYSDENSVVILSINNPYLKVTDLKSYIFCNDICDYIPWLNMLKVTRKMPALGYTFCCHLSEAIDYIPEIPKHCMDGGQKQIKINDADDKIVSYINSNNNNNNNHIKDNDKDKQIAVDYVVKRDSYVQLKENATSSDLEIIMESSSPRSHSTLIGESKITKQLNDDDDDRNNNNYNNDDENFQDEEHQDIKRKSLSLLIDVGEEGGLYDMHNDGDDDDDDEYGNFHTDDDLDYDSHYNNKNNNNNNQRSPDFRNQFSNAKQENDQKKCSPNINSFSNAKP